MKNKKVLMIISIVTLVSFIIGFSYAYFTTIVIGNDTASSNITTSGSLKLTYNGTDYISLENSQPGATDSMTFTVTNTGSLPLSNYEIYLSNLINTFTNDEVIYEIDCVSSDAVSCLGKTQTPLPIVETLSITQGSIAPGTTHTYTLTVSFIDTGSLQDYNQDKEFYFKITIDEQYDLPTFVALTGPLDTRYFWGYKTSITNITFEDEIDIPVGAFASWDVSELQDGSIMAYIIDDGLGTSTYELFIQTNNDLILANLNSSYLFYDFRKVISINNLSLLNTSKVTNMSCMFRGLQSLTTLDVSSLDTSKVTNMSTMFYGCSGLTSLDLSSFNTSKFTSMSGMFYGCSGLISLDLSSFDTSKVTNMSDMFFRCSKLTSVDLSNSIINNSINRCGIFGACKSDLNIIVNDLNSKTLYEDWLNNNIECYYGGGAV